MQLRSSLDPFKTRSGVHLHHERTVSAFEHVNTSHSKPHDLRRAHRSLDILRRQLTRLNRSTTMDIRTKLVPFRASTHRGNHPITHHKRANISASALSYKALNEDIVPGGVQGLDDRFSHTYLRRENNPDTLRALQQLYNHRRPTNPLTRGTNIRPPPHKRRRGHRNIMPRENLTGPSLITRVSNTIRRVRSVHIHLLKLPHNRRTKIRNRATNTRHNSIIIRQRPPTKQQIRLRTRQINREPQRIKHPHTMPPIHSSRPQPLRRVRPRRTRQNHKPHKTPPNKTNQPHPFKHHHHTHKNQKPPHLSSHTTHNTQTQNKHNKTGVKEPTTGNLHPPTNQQSIPKTTSPNTTTGHSPPPNPKHPPTQTQPHTAHDDDATTTTTPLTTTPPQPQPEQPHQHQHPQAHPPQTQHHHPLHHHPLHHPPQNPIQPRYSPR